MKHVYFLALSIGFYPLINTGDVALFPNGVTDSKTYTYNFDAKGTLQVENDSGAITINGWDKQQLQVEVTKHAQTKEDLELVKAEIEVKDKDTKGKIKTKYKRSQVNAYIDYAIHVPHNTKIKAQVGSGTISIANITHKIDAQAGSGKITITGARKKVEAKAGSGSIRVSYADDGYGKTETKAGAGTILVTNAGGSINAKAGAGSVQIAQRVLSANDSINVLTGSGSITLTLPINVNATIKAETKTGNIASGNFPWERKKERFSALFGDEAKLILGKGYAGITLKTTSGSIQVQQQ